MLWLTLDQRGPQSRCSNWVRHMWLGVEYTALNPIELGDGNLVYIYWHIEEAVNNFSF